LSTRFQFRRHFLLAFFVRKCFAQLFSDYSLALYFFGETILAQKLLVKCWWNWLQSGNMPKISVKWRRQSQQVSFYRPLFQKARPFHPTKINVCTVKHVYNDHPCGPKIVAVADSWSLFRGHFNNTILNWDFKMVVVVNRWSLFRGGHYSEGVVNSGLTVFENFSNLIFKDLLADINRSKSKFLWF